MSIQKAEVFLLHLLLLHHHHHRLQQLNFLH
jgi:hypothetical protein